MSILIVHIITTELCQVDKPSMEEEQVGRTLSAEKAQHHQRIVETGDLVASRRRMTSRILREVCEVSSTMIRSCRRMLAPPSQLFFAPAAVPALHGYHEKVPFHSSAVREE
jgi:hypothetical protein